MEEKLTKTLELLREAIGNLNELSRVSFHNLENDKDNIDKLIWDDIEKDFLNHSCTLCEIYKDIASIKMYFSDIEHDSKL